MRECEGWPRTTKAADRKELVDIHNQSAALVAPATPRSILCTRQTERTIAGEPMN